MNIKIHSLDHIVYNTNDIDAALHFYVDVLGLQGERIAEYRSGNVPFPSVRLTDRTIIDFFPASYSGRARDGENVNHIAVSVSNSASEIEAFLRERNIAVAREMTGNFGAAGDNAHSFQVRDPDGNLIEIQTYE